MKWFNRKAKTFDTRLLGSWETDPSDREAINRYGKTRLEFKADGTLVYSIDAGDKWQQMFLTYTTEGNILVTDQPSSPRQNRTIYDFTGTDELVLDYGGAKSRYVRAQ